MNGYIKPRSVTFWAGVFMILQGVIVASVGIHGQVALAETITTLAGDMGPAWMVNTGIALIGLRKAIRQ